MLRRSHGILHSVQVFAYNRSRISTAPLCFAPVALTRSSPLGFAPVALTRSSPLGFAPVALTRSSPLE